MTYVIHNLFCTQVDGRIIVDTKTFMEENPDYDPYIYDYQLPADGTSAIKQHTGDVPTLGFHSLLRLFPHIRSL